MTESIIMSKSATAAEKRHMGRVAGLCCVVCRNIDLGMSPAQIHHIRAGQGMSQRASNYLVIPLCPEHHKDGGAMVALHAGQKQWENLYGSELELLAQTIGDLGD